MTLYFSNGNNGKKNNNRKSIILFHLHKYDYIISFIFIHLSLYSITKFYFEYYLINIYIYLVINYLITILTQLVDFSV